MKIKKVSTLYNLVINPKDDNEKQKMIYGEYGGAIGLSTWLWCDSSLSKIIESTDNDCTSYLFNEDTFIGVKVTVSGDDEAASLGLLQKSVEEFMNNCEV